MSRKNKGRGKRKRVVLDAVTWDVFMCGEDGFHVEQKTLYLLTHTRNRRILGFGFTPAEALAMADGPREK